jgi:hypothetical protein
MGRDKRKGKETVDEPPKKKTRSQKEAECAAMAARAADDQVASRGCRLQIHEPGARTEEQQGEQVNCKERYIFVRRDIYLFSIPLIFAYASITCRSSKCQLFDPFYSLVCRDVES